MKILVLTLIAFNACLAYGQTPNPPCGNTYGNSQDAANIVQQMRFGTIADAQNAISQAKNTRGTSLGCAEASYNYNPANYAQPSLSSVATIWNSAHLPAIESFTIGCPRIGRYENNASLGAYYAQLAGYPADLNVLYNIASMQMAQQYSSLNVTSLNTEHEGVFGYIHVPSNDPCYPGGVVGSSVDAVCTNIPSYCLTYDNGIFAGETFLVGDQYEPLSFYDGGIAYDHGWIGTHLMEAAIQQNDPQEKQALKNSLLLATQWAMNQEAVKNHNYTSKLIWLLAQMYNWTGESYYRDALNYKLDKSLLPSILMDSDLDNFVDGTSPPIAFQDLTLVAQTPGRNWDGHNSLPWYNAMNAWALVEAYASSRDRGDNARAQELKPYVIATLDNLSWEINNLGIIDDQLGVRDLTHGLLLGIWKLAQYENEPHPNWESAAWAMWNSGYFNTYNTHSVCVGLYLCVLNQTAYEPPFVRESFLSTEENQLAKLNVYPNPSNGLITISYENHYFNSVMITNMAGQILHTQDMSTDVSIDLTKFGSGMYFVRVSGDKGSLTEKVVVK